MFLSNQISLPPFKRGFHLITDIIVKQLPELGQVEHGVLTSVLQHTSASLSLNEMLTHPFVVIWRGVLGPVNTIFVVSAEIHGVGCAAERA